MFISSPGASTCRRCATSGLRIVGPEPLHVPRVNATDDARSIGTVDLVMLCVKLWDTEAALEQIRPLVGAQTAIVSFQNGVLKDQALRAAYGDGPVMGGVGYVATTIDRPGVIRQTGPMQRLLFGEFDGSRSARGEAFLAGLPRRRHQGRTVRPTSCARSGRSSSSWSACRARRPRSASPSVRSARTRRRAPSCST